MEPSVTLYYQTTDYGMFKMLEGNRLLNESKINKILADIKGGTNLLPHYPILVDSNMNVLDGQHRLYCAKKLKLPIHFSVSMVRLDIFKIARINSRVERWKMKDYLNCYMRKDFKDYKMLSNFMAKYGFNINVGMQLLRNPKSIGDGGGGAYTKEQFESGGFKVYDFELSIKLADIIKDHFGFFEKSKNRQFVREVCKIYFDKEKGVQELIKLSKYLKENEDERTKLHQSNNFKHYFNRIVEKRLEQAV